MSWEEMFAELKKYKAKHGDCDVPHNWSGNPKLGPWVSQQRHTHKTDKLSKERTSRLEKIGFVWNPLAAKWESMFLELQKYKAKHGHCNVPSQWSGRSNLGLWVRGLRHAYKKDLLSKERISRLEKLGFLWNPLAAKWEEMFVELRKYKSKHGNCNVPNKFEGNPRLGEWVSTQRAEYQKDNLSKGRISRLNSLGFAWDSHEAAWEEMFQALKKYKAKHGDCLVPWRWSDNEKLAGWVASQRRALKQGRLSKDRIAKLDSIGFVWEIKPTPWEEMFQALCDYKAKHGDTLVPLEWKENPQLALWIRTQRKSYSKGQLSKSRLQRLEKIGFVWSLISNAWDEMFASLKDFKAKHGDCRVPNDWNENPQLAIWIKNQRRKYSEGLLSKTRIKRLEKLGFEFNLWEASWEKMFNQLKAYKKKHGDCDVPQRWTENPELGVWVSNQRTRKRQKLLSKERIARLNKIGFSWKVES
ncbi:helicase associated domain-containing protein [Bythopirellula polymerisocia]|nr:helicase associated domain-containing protein [Bythopirellula polymerisocia]